MVRFAFNKKNHTKKGQSLIEIIITIGLLAIVIPTIYFGIIIARQSNPKSQDQFIASTLLTELIESTKSVKDANWNTLATLTAGTEYHTKVDGANWTVVAGKETITANGIEFTRYIVVTNVNRDNNAKIAITGGLNDPSTKLVTGYISWSNPNNQAISYSIYLTRAKTNEIKTNDLSQGTFNNTVYQNGMVTLKTKSGNWSNIQQQDTYNTSASTDFRKTFISGNYMYSIATSTGNSPNFLILDITDPQNINYISGIAVGADLNDVYIEGDYAYLATSGNSTELTIVNISNKSAPTISATFNVGDNSNALSIYKKNQYLYIGKQSNPNREFYIIDVSNLLAPTQVSSYEIGNSINSLYIDQNYAYLANNSNSKELIILDVSNNTIPTEISSYNLPSNSDATDLFIKDDYIYITTLQNNSGTEFYILNQSNISGIQTSSSYEIGTNANTIYSNGDYAIIGTSSTRTIAQLVIIDASDKSNITLSNQYDVSGTVYDVSVFGNLLAVSTNNSSTEIILYSNGSSSSYYTDGTYESPIFDMTTQVAYNHFSFTYPQIANTEIKAQVAISDDPNNMTYIGPDGLTTSYYTDLGSIYFHLNTGSYFKYKIYFSGDGTNSPLLQSAFINYTP